MSCIFCEIVAGRAPATVVEKWPGAIAIVPLNPVVEGHTLIIPKLHVRDAAEDPWTTAKVMYQAAKYARRFDSHNIITSTGPAATQSVPHLHIHVVPRAENDQLMVPWGTVFGDTPHAPHWCPAAQKLTVKLAEAMMDSDALVREPLSEMIRDLWDVDQETAERVSAEALRRKSALTITGTDRDDETP